MKIHQIVTEIKEYQSANELPEDEAGLILEARNAANQSYSPYSKFKVGAALLLKSGKLVTGSNQENAAYPSGLCAERTAIFWANAQYPDDPVVKLAISAQNINGQLQQPISPCGACRQVMLETENRFKTPITTLLDGASCIYVISKVADLLPLHFSPEDLKIG